ncbi:MAG: hypothetical protein GY851_01515, partial [bacterium]|nr:hypothetical protein [bacterium]
MAFSKTSGASKRRGKRREGFRLIAKTLFGLEEILAGELREMGAREVRPGNRVVEFSGDMESMYRANLWCRTATRILMPVRTFRAGDKDELYAGAARVFWDRYLDVGGTLAVDAVVSRSALNNSHYVALRVKDAIVDQFREKRGRRPSIDTDRPDVRVHIHVHENNATLALDSSGGPLGRRGYRTEAGEAPIGENLAAGIVALTEWDGTLPFVDGMCGSGTFAIEAAMKARRIAPGLCRRE